MNKQKKNLGTAVITPCRPVRARSHGTWRITYTAGDDGIAKGGSINIFMRMMSDWGKLQNRSSKADNYLTFTTTGKASLSFVNHWKGRPRYDFFPWMHRYEFRVTRGSLKKGDKVTLVMGDTSKGSRGARVQRMAQKGMEFRVLIDPEGDGNRKMLAEHPALDIIGGKPVRARVYASSTPDAKKALRAVLKLEDAVGNVSRMYNGKVELRTEDGKRVAVRSFKKGQACTSDIKGLKAPAKGIMRIKVKGDRGITGQSNPICPAKDKEHIYWGDLHAHTIWGDGTGSTDEYFTYARDAAGLDFCASSEEDYHFTDRSWVRFINAVKKYHEPGRFVTFLGYEWSGWQDGDHNVYYLDDTGPLYRCGFNAVGKSEWLVQRNTGQDHPLCKNNEVVPRINQLYDKLRGKRAMIIPHVGGGKGNFMRHDPSLEFVAEIHSVHGTFEWYAQEALGRGYKLGMIGGGDCHSGRPGDSHVHGPFRCHSGLSAVFAKELTRKAIWDGIKKRRVYATTGERIILDFKVNGRAMGGMVCQPDTSKPRKIKATVIGTDTIQSISIIKNNFECFTCYPDKPEETIEYIDREPATGYDFYYLRVLQKDPWHMAWSSPVWVADERKKLKELPEHRTY